MGKRREGFKTRNYKAKSKTDQATKCPGVWQSRSAMQNPSAKICNLNFFFIFSCVPNHLKVQESECRVLQARKSNDLKQFTCWKWEDIVSVRGLRQSKAGEKQQVRSLDKQAEDQHAGSALADPSSEAQGCFGALSALSPSLPCLLSASALTMGCVCVCVCTSLSLSLSSPSLSVPLGRKNANHFPLNLLLTLDTVIFNSCAGSVAPIVDISC